MIYTALPVSTHHWWIFFSHKKSTLSLIKKKSSNIFTDDSVYLLKNTEDSYELIEGFGLFLNIWHSVCGCPVVVVCFWSRGWEAGGGCPLTCGARWWKAGFLHHGTIDLCGWIIPCCGGGLRTVKPSAAPWGSTHQMPLAAPTPQS